MTMPIVIFAILSSTSRAPTSNSQNESKFGIFTLGSIVEFNSFCGLYKDQTSIAENKRMLSLNCLNGVIDASSYVFGMLKEEKKDCRLVYKPNVITECNKGVVNGTRKYIDERMWNDCHQKHNCSLSLTTSQMNSLFSRTGNCASYYDNTTGLQTPTIYLGVYCLEATLKIGDKFNYALKDIAFMITMIDAAVIIVYIYMIFNLNLSGTKAINNIISNSLSANALTIEVTNLPKDKPKEQLIGELWTHYETYFNTVYKAKQMKEKKNKYVEEDPFKIVDIQISQSSKVMAYEIKLNQLMAKKIDMVKCYRRDYDKEEKLPDMTYLQDVRMHFQTNVPEDKKLKAQKIIEKLSKLEETIE